ncbi:hypothetical protein [Companilactobacillus musae]|uniref:hypothetical protein n=2 Tax=Companilactobacillus musae TaxID=1903258 RepID=UPI000F8315DD|nr:hypothetical protein [Companilactobacillus musae]
MKRTIMLKNWLATFKLQFKIALKEKIVFFYTLVIPIIIVFLNNQSDFKDVGVLYIYWSYIVVTSILNGFMSSIVQLRENGSLKTLTYMVGSKSTIITASVFVQMIIIQVEILIFNLVVNFMVIQIPLMTYVYGILMTFITTIFATVTLSVMFLFKVKQGTFNVLINIFLLLGIGLLGFRPGGIWNYLFTLINPFQFVLALYSMPKNSILLNYLVMGFAVIYLGMGYWNLHNISIKSQLSRV